MEQAIKYKEEGNKKFKAGMLRTLFLSFTSSQTLVQDNINNQLPTIQMLLAVLKMMQQCMATDQLPG